MTEKKINIESWENLLVERVHNPGARRAALKYIEKLAEAGVPPIFDFEQLSELVGVNRGILAGFVENAEAFYRSFTIPKQSGGFREISSPTPTLLMIQKWIKTNILDEIPVHNAAHGFVRDRSVITFAKAHVNKTALLHIDVSDFFSFDQFAEGVRYVQRHWIRAECKSFPCQIMLCWRTLASRGSNQPKHK